MVSQKLVFNNDGTTKTIDSYILSNEEEEASRNVEKYDEDIEDPYTYMDIEDIKKIEAKKKKINNTSLISKKKSYIDKSHELTSHGRVSSKINKVKKKMGRQEILLNSSGKESLRRTYLIEAENIKRLEEIKVFLLF